MRSNSNNIRPIVFFFNEEARDPISSGHRKTNELRTRDRRELWKRGNPILSGQL